MVTTRRSPTICPSARAASSFCSSALGMKRSRLAEASDGAGAGGAPSPRLWPQLLQNRASAGCSAPQLGHVAASLAPQLLQNFAWAGFAAPHVEHFIASVLPADRGTSESRKQILPLYRLFLRGSRPNPVQVMLILFDESYLVAYCIPERRPADRSMSNRSGRWMFEAGWCPRQATGAFRPARRPRPARVVVAARPARRPVGGPARSR